MVGKRDWGKPQFIIKLNSPFQMFKYALVYSHYPTNHAKAIGLEGPSSSTTKTKTHAL